MEPCTDKFSGDISSGDTSSGNSMLRWLVNCEDMFIEKKYLNIIKRTYYNAILIANILSASYFKTKIVDNVLFLQCALFCKRVFFKLWWIFF